MVMKIIKKGAVYFWLVINDIKSWIFQLVN